MRQRIWKFVRNGIPEGLMLPFWLLVIRAMLFPLEFFYWKMSKARGYQWDRDEWIINGIKYSAEALRSLAKAQGEVFKVTRTGETVVLERMPGQYPPAPMPLTTIPMEIGDDEILIITFKQNFTAEQLKRFTAVMQEGIDSVKKVIVIEGDPSLYVVKRKALQS